MTPREFFYAVASMRDAQRQYFKTRDRRVFAKARALENSIDEEIRRVKLLKENHDK